MNNTAYSRTMPNLKNRIDEKKGYLKWTSKPSYISQKIFNNNLIAISKSKVTLKSNELAYAGMSILDLSKLLICEFHYDYFQNKYANKSRLLFTDTESLSFQIKTEDVYEDFNKDKEMFDFSSY